MPSPFFHAFTFGFMSPAGFTTGQGWKHSLREMVRTTGCDSVVLPVTALQDHAYSTQIDYLSPQTLSRDDALAFSREARALGLKVILKAMVNCRDGYWRAYIRFFDRDVPTEPGWADWFASYGDFVLYTADTARLIGADMLCIGCETVGTDHREAEWRRLIDGVRGRYPGPITYNCDKYQEDSVRWWDAVDYISSSGYYPLGDIAHQLDRIAAVSSSFGKPFLFLEAGCPSREGSPLRPNDWRHPGRVSPEAQKAWYDEMTREILARPFVRGVCWWDWSALRLYPEPFGPDDPGYCVYGKPAARTLLSFSAALRERN